MAPYKDDVQRALKNFRSRRDAMSLLLWNGMSEEELRIALERAGVSWKTVVKDLHCIEPEKIEARVTGNESFTTLLFIFASISLDGMPDECSERVAFATYGILREYFCEEQILLTIAGIVRGRAYPATVLPMLISAEEIWKSVLETLVRAAITDLSFLPQGHHGLARYITEAAVKAVDERKAQLGPDGNLLRIPALCTSVMDLLIPFELKEKLLELAYHRVHELICTPLPLLKQQGFGPGAIRAINKALRALDSKLSLDTTLTEAECELLNISLEGADVDVPFVPLKIGPQ